MKNVKIKQRDISDCGAACLASVAAYYKLKLPIALVRQYANTDQKGTNILGLIQAAERLGFSAKGVKGPMEALGKIPLPAIAHTIVKNKDKELQHYVVIYTVKKDKITYMDPGDGEMHKEKVEDFSRKWSCVLVLLVPNENFTQSNKQYSILRRFLFLLQPHKGILFQALLGAMVYTILGLSTSIYIQKITDNVFANGNVNLLNLLSVIMILVLLLQIFLGVNKSLFMLNTGQKIDARLILGYYKHLLKLPQRFFDTMRVGEIISRVNDAIKIRVFINDILISLVINVFIVIFSFALMFVFSWKLALIMVVVIPFYLVIYFITNRLNKKQERKLMEDAADLESQFVESVTAVKTIKQFGIEEYANIKTENRFIRLLESVYKSAINSLFSSNSSEFMNRIIAIIILWIGSYYVINNSITPGELMSFYALIGYLTSPIKGLIEMNKSIQNAVIAADRLFEIMDLDRENNEDLIMFSKDSIGDILFENVSFSYGTRVKVFENFNLKIEKGKLTAIIGESGSGKTTLVALLQKLYPLESGEIFIGSTNINYYENHSLRNAISSVPQQLNLFAGSIVENIAIGEFSPNLRRVIDICTMLGMMSFIEKLPKGFNTYIGENGASLSGGQKQRLAIARALYMSPQILILDEATSSLDSESEDYVQQTIRRLREEGITIIIIAHRLSTIKNADTIVVLEDGKVVEQGNHNDLCIRKGRYYSMLKKQTATLL